MVFRSNCVARMSDLDLAQFGEDIARPFTVDFAIRSIANPGYVLAQLTVIRTALALGEVVGITVEGRHLRPDVNLSSQVSVRSCKFLQRSSLHRDLN